MASSNASAEEGQISREMVEKFENAHRRQASHMLIESFGLGKALSNCQNPNHIRKTNRKTPVLPMHLHSELNYIFMAES